MSAYTSKGAPTGISAPLADMASFASIPDRTFTCTRRLLFDVRRSFAATARACAVKETAVVLSAVTFTVAELPGARSPSEQIAVFPEIEQLPWLLLAERKLTALPESSVTVNSVDFASIVP